MTSAALYVGAIERGLAAADPEGAGTYKANAAAYLAELDALDAAIRAAVVALPEDRRTVVTSHDAFGHFAADYGLTFVAPQGISTEAEASAQDVAVAEKTRLDAIVTVVDAVNLSTHLDEAHEAAEQIAFADRILLNKVDLVDAAALATAEARIRAINPYAKIVKTEKCGIALDQVLGLDAFSLERVLEIEPDFLNEDHTHGHEEDITSVSLSSDRPLDEAAFREWFGLLLRQHGQDILRSKGILDFKGQDERFVVHAVHMLADGSPLGRWPAGKPRSSKRVFIGRNLDRMQLKQGFAACAAD